MAANVASECFPRMRNPILETFKNDSAQSV